MLDGGGGRQSVRKVDWWVFQWQMVVRLRMSEEKEEEALNASPCYHRKPACPKLPQTFGTLTVQVSCSSEVARARAVSDTTISSAIDFELHRHDQHLVRIFKMTVSTDSDGTKLSSLRARNEQNLDNRKGFAYLESFSELEDWKATEVDPIHRANTPLYLRPSLDDNARGKSGSKVMLIHDYAGGYNDYECAQGTAAEIESYSCNYLHNVDSFVYFSHKLLSVPPPTWTNTCHRNGVKALGTFLVERGSKDVERILEQDEHGNFWVAQKLASLANCYGFDGFLINIETTFSLLAWSANKLEDFLRQLRYELRPSGKLVW